MNWITELFKERFNPSGEELVETGVCPNCWGKQSYDGKFNEYVEDRTKANISGDQMGRKAFIQQFVEDHVDGIRLKNDGGVKRCQVCSTAQKE